MPQDTNSFFDATPGNTQPSQDLSQNNLSEYMDYVFRENGGPGYSSVLFNLLRGVRILGPGNQMVPIPDDTIGLAFVTRPLLNLSDENIKSHIHFAPLRNPDKNSINAYIKGLLDYTWGKANAGMSDLLDPYYAWVAPATNLLKVSSGFPDLQLNIGKSQQGFRKEVRQHVNGILKVNYDYDISQSYYPSKPMILPAIYDYWVNYIEAVSLGDEGMEPYYDALFGNYLDYDTRIYHMILNKNMRSIEGLYCSASSIPHTFPSGAFSTIDRTQTSLRGQGQDEFQINFSSVGFRYGNVRVADMFNRTTIFFNPNMHPQVRSRYYRQLSMAEYYTGGYQSYPWININTMELEYWSKR